METISYLCIHNLNQMKKNFEVVFLEDAIEFIEKIEPKARKKLYYNLDKATFQKDPKLFKKLSEDIWEFRTLYQGMQYRLFAFWDRSKEKETLVVCTHGTIKKVSKVPKNEIEKAIKLKVDYFENKI